MTKQLTHQTTSFQSKKFPIKIICDGVQSPANIGGLFRISEAFGVSELIFCNASINFSSSRLRKTARHTVEKVPFRLSESILSEIKELQKHDYKIIALELTETSIPLEKLTLNAQEKLALIIGHEQHGISETVLKNVHESTHIRMFGTNSSINVVQAAGIALFTLTKLLN